MHIFWIYLLIFILLLYFICFAIYGEKPEQVDVVTLPFTYLTKFTEENIEEVFDIRTPKIHCGAYQGYLFHWRD